MRGRVLLVGDGLNGALPWVAQTLRDSGLNITTVASSELAEQLPADAVLLRLNERNASTTCWTLHRQGHRSVVAVSPAANSRECVRLLNSGADYYLDAWMPAAELVARVRVVLRLAAWLDGRSALPASQPAGSFPEVPAVLKFARSGRILGASERIQGGGGRHER
jgi:DNA-binding response OmpR family regulator